MEHVALFEAAARHAAPRLRALDRGFANPQKVATLAWFYAKAAVYAPALMDALAAACGAIVDELLPVDVANVAMRHGARGRFSCRGIALCLAYLESRFAGNCRFAAFLPEYMLDAEKVAAAVEAYDPALRAHYEKIGKKTTPDSWSHDMDKKFHPQLREGLRAQLKKQGFDFR